MTTIAIDASALKGETAGIPRYIQELLLALGKLSAPEKFVVLRRGRPKDFPPFPNLETIAADRPLWLTLFVPYTLLRKHCNLIHFPYPALPPWLPCRSIITIHDLAFVRNPEWFLPDRLEALQRAWLPAVRRADHILCDSEFTRAEMIALLGVDARKMTVACLGVGEEWQLNAAQDALPHPNGGRPYILSVGTLQPRKNYPRLVEAFAESTQQLREVDLCIVGTPGWKLEDLVGLAAARGVGRRVKLLRATSDEELLGWYHHATALALVSLYEGFGLPLLEAMAQGVPCLASHSSALVEVAGDAAALADPQDTTSIAQGLVRVCSDTELRAGLRKKGFARAKEFTWERCAQSTLQAYRMTIGQ